MPNAPGEGDHHLATGGMEGLWGYTAGAGIAFLLCVDTADGNVWL